MPTIRKNWTHQELLLALRLYWQTPFGQQHQRHPPIVKLAKRLGRTPSAVAMKLNNFTSLDPTEQARGIVGLSGASRLDKEIWKRFSEEPLDTVDAMESALEAMAPGTQKPAAVPSGLSEIVGEAKVRRHQRFFRETVLTNYGWRCCLTGNSVSGLLRASHIVPWVVSERERVNPRNGLCLNALHDVAFDRGWISFDEEQRMLVSSHLRKHLPNPAIERDFIALAGHSIAVPDKNLPDPEFLAYHRKTVFVS